jgi:hypothetical protein
MLRDGVVSTVCLGAALVADEDHLAAMVLQLLQVRRRVSHIYNAPEHPEVVHHRLPTMPRLERSHAINALHQTPIQDIHSDVHRLTLEPPGRPLAFSMLLVVATTVPFQRSMMSFYYGL